MNQSEREDAINRLMAVAAKMHDCSAMIVLHVSEDGESFSFHRCGNVYAQLGALRTLEAGLRAGLVKQDWDVHGVDG